MSHGYGYYRSSSSIVGGPPKDSEFSVTNVGNLSSCNRKGNVCSLLSSLHNPSCIVSPNGASRVCCGVQNITFTTSNDLSNVTITPEGVLVVGTEEPAANKVAHFEGDIKVTGIIDPTGVQFEEVNVAPTSTSGTSTGLIWVRSGAPNLPVFTNNLGQDILFGDVRGPIAAGANQLPRFDGTSGKLIKSSNVTLDDNNIFNSSSVLGMTSVGNLTMQSTTGDVIISTVHPYATKIDGDVYVSGTTFSVNTKTMNVKDDTIYLNNGYTGLTPKSGGLVINYSPSSNVASVDVGGFTAGVNGVSNPTVAKTNSYTFMPGDLVQVSSANNMSNDGLFEVLVDTGTLLSIKGVGLTATSANFVQTQFETDPVVSGEIRQVNLLAIESTNTGQLGVRKGSNTSDANIVTASLVVLQVSANGGGDATLVNTSPQGGPNVTVKDLTAGAGISLINGADSVTISAAGGGGGGLSVANFMFSGSQTFMANNAFVVNPATTATGNNLANWSNVGGVYTYSGSSAQVFISLSVIITFTLLSSPDTAVYTLERSTNGGGTWTPFASLNSRIFVSGNFVENWLPAMTNSSTFNTGDQFRVFVTVNFIGGDQMYAYRSFSLSLVT